MWLKKSQQRGEWCKRGEHKTGTKRGQGAEALRNITDICFLLSAIRSQTVKFKFCLLNKLAGITGKFEANCEQKPGIKCRDFRFLPHTENINSFSVAHLRKYNVVNL